jgi:flagellar biosynthesis/type III secretory pathway chaperone
VTAAHVDTSGLAVTLREETEVYGSLLALSVQEERALIAGNVERLTELVADKEQLLELLAALESERTSALIAVALGIERDPPTITLSEVARHAEPAAAEVLMQAGMLLRAQAVALREANDRNARLLEGSRALVEHWIQYLRALVAGALTYTADGGRFEGDDGRVLDRSA